MDKQPLQPAVALQELNKGKTLYYDTTDGYATMKKISKTKYEFTVFNVEEDETHVFYGTIQNVLKSMNDPNMAKGVYIQTE